MPDMDFEKIAAKLLPPENWPDFASGSGTVWTGRRKAIASALRAAREEGLTLREAELRDEQLKFQQETRRTSDLTVTLRRARDWIATPNGYTGTFNALRFADEIDTLLSKPINAPLDQATAPIEEVRAELERRGIDIGPAMEKVRAALLKKAREEGREEGIEEAAKVAARTVCSIPPVPHAPGVRCGCDTANEIAAAIRALASPAPEKNPLDPAIREEVRAELKRRGIDMTKATEKVLAAVAARKERDAALKCEVCGEPARRIYSERSYVDLCVAHEPKPAEAEAPGACGMCGGTGTVNAGCRDNLCDHTCTVPCPSCQKGAAR